MFTSVEEALHSIVPIPAYGPEITILCPFHEDHNPSLRVNRTSGLFQCKSCHVAGNFRKLYAKLAKITEMQADFRLKRVAYVSGKTIIKPVQDVALQATLDAYDYYSGLAVEDWANNTQDTYLFDRSYSPETLSTFDVRIDPERIYRYVFPLREQGTFIAVLKRREDFEHLKATPKYLNNNDFHKELHLVGNLVPGVVLLVEGLLDLMMAYQFGITNTAAILGNDISDVQLQLLLRYATAIVCGFDNDKAGEEGYNILVSKVDGRVPVSRLNISGVNDIPEMHKHTFLRSFYASQDSFISSKAS